nr:RNA-dependent RNA polymerase [Narnavirus sp.]
MYNKVGIQTERAASAFVSEPGTFQIPDRWVDRFVLVNPGNLLRSWGGAKYTTRMRLVRENFSRFYIQNRHFGRLARLPRDRMKALINLVSAVEDNLLFSHPDWFPIVHRSDSYKKLIRSCILQEIHKHGSFVDAWKQFTQWVRWHAYKSTTPRPELPPGFPGVHPREPEKLGHLWDTLTPWLRKILENGLTSKFQATQLSHFLTSRNMPAAGTEKQERALSEHREVLTSGGPNEIQRNTFLRSLMRNYGQKLKKKIDSGEYKDKVLSDIIGVAHVSLTNSASFYGPTNKGGRGSEVAKEFKDWLLEIATEDKDELTWFGHSYYLRKGQPRWQTMCRCKRITLEGRSHYASEQDPYRIILELPSFPKEAAFGGIKPLIDVDFENFVYTDPIYGIDSLIGCQLYQWSIEKGLSLNELQGTPYKSEKGLYPNPNLPPRIKAAVIGEPGNKARVVTVGEAWLTIFLQPFAHVLAAYLKHDMNANSGFERSWHGFEYVRRMAYQSISSRPKRTNRYILSSDLKTATDYCPHEYAKSMLFGLVEGLGYDAPLIGTWIELLTGPRRYMLRNQKVPLITNRGILMGDPGAKVVLSLFNIAAEREAKMRYLRSIDPKTSDLTLIKKLREGGIAPCRLKKKKAFLFAFSGDDHVAIGPRRYLEEITRSHIRNGMKVSTSTNYISNICGTFCEEQIFIRSPVVWKFWGSGKPLHLFPYKENPHVSSLKLRLLSLCSKEFINKVDTNPAIGMASTLTMMLSWLSEGWECIRTLASKRFRQKMRGLIPKNRVLAALPRLMGGIDNPEFGLSREEFETHYSEIPEWFQRLLALHICRSEEVSPLLRRILARIPGAHAYRGIDADGIEEQVREGLMSTTCKSINLNDFSTMHGMTSKRWSTMKKKQQLNWIKNHTDYIPISSAIEVLSRSAILKELLLPSSEKTKPLGKAAFRQIKWETRYERLQKYLNEILEKKPEQKELYNTINDSDLERTKERIWKIISQQEQLDLSKEYWFVPKSVISSPDVVSMKLGHMGSSLTKWKARVPQCDDVFIKFNEFLETYKFVTVAETDDFVVFENLDGDRYKISRKVIPTIQCINDLKKESKRIDLQEAWKRKEEVLRAKDKQFRKWLDEKEERKIRKIDKYKEREKTWYSEEQKNAWTEGRILVGSFYTASRTFVHKSY